MVEVIQNFKNSISGELFYNIEDATIAEIKSLDIKNSFVFYDAVEDEGLNFINGKFCVQRDEKLYKKLLKTLLNMVNKHEVQITDKYFIQKGSMSIEDVKGHSILGRFLNDSNSELYHWWYIQLCICPTCFKEYGQSYYALNCLHNNKIPVKIIK